MEDVCLDINELEQAIHEFYCLTRNKRNSRNLSWEYCYKSFIDARNCVSPDYDYLSLQLSFYLASWGMYRGSSFLIERDYKVHEGVVRIVLDEKYDSLVGVECEKIVKDDYEGLIKQLCEAIENSYIKIRESVMIEKKKTVKNGISQVLISKVLLGTMGCVPAYDEYVSSELKKYGFINRLCWDSLKELARYYINNVEKLEQIRKDLLVYDLKYPQMKLLDMGLWQMRKKALERDICD